MFPPPLTRPLGMDFQKLLPSQGRIVQQPVGGFGLRPTPTRQRNTPCWRRRQIIHQLDQPKVSPCIPPIQGFELLLRPTHLTLPYNSGKLIFYNKLQLWVNGWCLMALIGNFVTKCLVSSDNTRKRKRPISRPFSRSLKNYSF